jgi:hypothetical protein
VLCDIDFSIKNPRTPNPITSDEGTKKKGKGVVFVLMSNGSSSKAQSKKMGLQT